MTDRIPCINPACRRTAPADGEHNSICCRKCWRLLPHALTARYRQLNNRNRRLMRHVDRRIAQGTISKQTVERVGDVVFAQMDKNWSAIRAYFVRPEKPVGLDGFLQEIGL